jgi:hypothetical protein
MNSKHEKLLKLGMCCLAALLLGFEVFCCTREVVKLEQRGFHWGWWSWTPCFFNIYLLMEAILSKNKTAKITACTLMVVDLAADCLVLSGAFDTLLWPYVLLALAGMIVLLVCEDNSFLKKMNLFTLVLIVIGAFSAHL